MMVKYRPSFVSQPVFFLVICALIPLVSGCARSAAVNYYQLAAVDSKRVVADTNMIGGAVIGIGPVNLPEYLVRRQMVVRQGEGRLQLSDSHRWVEPLADNIPRVLREDLAILLKTEQLMLYPWERDAPVAYQLVIELLRFEGNGFREGHLEAVWTVRDSNGDELLPPRRSSYTVAAASPDHTGLTAALSETLFLLCREIVQSLSQYAGAKGS